MKEKLILYWNNLWLAIDQLLNAILGGDPDETISSRIGKIKREGRLGRHWYWRWLDVILDKIDKNHSIDAIEEDEGKHSL